MWDKAMNGVHEQLLQKSTPNGLTYHPHLASIIIEVRELSVLYSIVLMALIRKRSKYLIQLCAA